MQEITDKQRKTRAKYAKKGSINKKVLIIVILCLVLSSFVVISERLAKSSNSTDDITAMIRPIQEDLEGPVIFAKDINGIKVTMIKVAKYQIAGRVVESYDYTSGMANIIEAISTKSAYNDIAIKDVAIAYGPMALVENHKKMTYIMSGARKIAYAVKDYSLFNTVGDIDVVKTYITNNHLIPANDEVRELIKKIDTDDYVQISGYLVDAMWEYGMYQYNLETSTTRTDVGDGACEIIYVEDVKWIH